MFGSIVHRGIWVTFPCFGETFSTFLGLPLCSLWAMSRQWGVNTISLQYCLCFMGSSFSKSCCQVRYQLKIPTQLFSASHFQRKARDSNQPQGLSFAHAFTLITWLCLISYFNNFGLSFMVDMMCLLPADWSEEWKMKTNHLELHDAIFWVSARSSQAVGRDHGAGGLLHGASTSSLFWRGFTFLRHFKLFW